MDHESPSFRLEAPPGDEYVEAPLSHGQRALWFLSRLNPGSASYNVMHAARISHELDLGALRRALQIIVDRHPSLRATFVEKDGQPVQRIYTASPVDFTVLDASGWSNAQIDQALAAEMFRPFDLERGPLFRTIIFSQAPDRHVGLFAMHHLVTDMWSIAVILHELGQIYASELRGAPLSLKPLQRTYIDFVHKQAELLAGPQGARLRAYWQAQLGGDLPALDLPADHPRPRLKSARGMAESLRLGPDLTRRLNELSRAQNVSIQATVLAAFQALLGRYTGQEEICVGFTKSGRSRETARLVGYFINPIVIRSTLSGDQPFAAFLQAVQRTMQAGSEHEAYPFPLVAADLKTSRDLSRTSLIQVLLSWQKTTRLVESDGISALSHSPLYGEGNAAAGRALQTGALSLEPYSLPYRVVDTDLTLLVSEVDNELHATLEYSLDLFEAPSIRRMLAHFQTLLEGIVADPNRPLARLPLLSAPEQTRLLAEWNAGQASYPIQPVHRFFEEQASRTPNLPALIAGGQVTTYAELDRRADQLAGYLQKLGVRPETIVGVCAGRSASAILAILGVLKAGGAYLPVDPAYPASRIRFMLADAGVQIVLTEAALLPRLQAEVLGGVGTIRVIRLDADWEEIAAEADGESPAPPEPRPGGFPSNVTPQDLAYVIYTSGSSGQPKGVMVSHASLANHTCALREVMELAPGDRLLQFISLSFDASAEEIYPALSCGATLVLREDITGLGGSRFMQVCEEEGITVLHLPVSYWHRLVDELSAAGQVVNAPLKTLLVGGEAPSPARLQAWAKLLASPAKFINAYGPTEATITSTVFCLPAGRLNLDPYGMETDGFRNIPIGRPIPNVQAYILDRYLQPLPPGVPGELYLAGAGLARGYLNQPELTEEKFVRHVVFSPVVDSQIVDSQIVDSRVVPSHEVNPSEDYPTNDYKTNDYPTTRLYKTGDLARFHPDGNLEFLGRIDQQVKLRGFRIELGEIESLLGRHPAVREAVVMAVENGSREKFLAAYLAVQKAQTLEESLLSRELQHFLRQELPEYMLPSAFIPLEELPKTPNGKIDRRALPAVDLSSLPAAAGAIPPRTPLEEMLAKVWADVLDVTLVGVYDNFFELGGHSLLATQVVSRINHLLDTAESGGFREISVRELFESPTVAGLAERCERILRERISPEKVSAEAQKRTASTGQPDLQPVSRAGELPHGPWPLSFSQERMWFVHQLDPQSSAYNITLATHFTGPVNLDAVRKSFDDIVRRHESLRTTIQLVDGRPVQVIAPAAPLELPVIDLRSGQADEARSETTVSPETEFRLQRLADEQAQAPFDLARGPVIRAQIILVSDNESVLTLTMHHAVSDAWSVGVLGGEFARLYEGYQAGVPAHLPELPIQYADFSYWQRQWFSADGRMAGALEAQRAYWKKQLANLPVLSLPTDRPRPATQSFRGAHQVFHLEADIGRNGSFTNRLKALGYEQGATLFMVFLAAYQTLLYRYTGQTDIAVGVPIANRHWLSTESLIGTFVNTLVLRTNFEELPSGNHALPTFRQVLRRVRETALQAYAHQDMPFEMLVAELQPSRDRSYSPLFQVFFDYTNIPTPAIKLPGLEWKPLIVDRRASQFDLTMSILDNKFERNIGIEYNTDLFDDATITRLIGHFRQLLLSLLEHPDTPISELNILSEDEQRQILVDWNHTESEYARGCCIHALFEEQARLRPQVVAVAMAEQKAAERQSLTYAELDNQANLLAAYLQSIGVGPDTLVGIYTERSLEMVVGLLGILKAGGAYLPLDPAYPPDRISYMLADSCAPVVLTHRGLLTRDLLSGCNPQIVNLDTDWPKIAASPAGEAQAGGSWNVLSQAGPENLAYVIYTSGSTGRPKGVQVLQRGVVNFLASMQNQPGIRPEDILLSVTTLSFDIAALEIFLPLVTGARVVLASREDTLDGRRLARRLAETGATLLQATPVTWRLLLEAGWEGDGRLKALCGGEALPRDLAEKLLARVGELWNMYGPTETTIWSTTCQITDPAAPITIGRPIANTQVYILQENLQPVPAGVAGELFIGGDGLARGYLNRTELTEEKFISHVVFRPVVDSQVVDGHVVNPSEDYPTIDYKTNDNLTNDYKTNDHKTNDYPTTRLYKTGDLARFLADGRIEILGRKDFQVKVRGFRIELGEIETNLSRYPAVRQAVVIPRPDSRGVTRLVAYLVLDPSENGSQPTPAELRTFLLERLPEYMVPSFFTFLEKFPLTANGKIDRRALPEPGQHRPKVASTLLAPRSLLETRLAEMWAELLGLERVGIQENFFDVGGHSILATRLVAQIETEFCTHLPVTAIFQSPTIEQLAAVIQTRQVLRTHRSIVPIQEQGDRPPFFCVHGLGGGIIDYGELGRLLGPDQPVFGIPAYGANGEGKPHSTIEEMAAHSIQAIRSTQPHGPYALGGYCFGGIVAYEMACQLRNAGEEVGLLAILEGYAPVQIRWTWRSFLASLPGFLSNLPVWGRGFLRLDPYQRIARLKRTARSALRGLASLFYRSGQIDLRDFLDEDIELIPDRHRALMKIHLLAQGHYRPRPYPGKITLFRVRGMSLFRSHDLAMGWGRLSREGVDVKMIEGLHFNILMKPQVIALAEELKASL